MRGSHKPLHKIRRLLKVVEYLQCGRGFNAGDLAEMCGVTRRQIFRDLKALQEAGVPVLYDASRRAYWLVQPAYLPSLELTLAEALSLIVLGSSLGDEAHGIPLQSSARDAALKLTNSLPPLLRQHVGELGDLIEVRAEPHHPLEGAAATLEDLQGALRERRQVRLRYHSLFERREIQTQLSPYRLLYSGRSWYVIGRSSQERAVRTFHVGRIRNCERLKLTYKIPARFSLDKHLGNAWRFIRDRKQTCTVRVRFQPLVADNVAEVVWHKTQQLSWNADGTLDFTARVDGINEISWWVLGYGDQAEVLEPPDLRELIGRRAQNMARMYRRKQSTEPASSRARRNGRRK